MLTAIFNLIAGIALVFFSIHYICYIVHTLSQSPNRTRSVGMQSEDAKYIKKRLKGDSIEPHPTEKALILNYKLEATVFSEPGQTMVEESKNCQRIIRLKSLNARTDPRALAQEVIAKCDIIHKSQLGELQQIIYYLQKRHCEVIDRSASDLRSRRLKSARSPSVTKEPPTLDDGEMANIRNIDDYVELLYEDLPERIRGSSLILKLARIPDNLEELEKNEALLSALSRVLREDWQKNLDLSTNIIFIFFCFSSYTRFHNVVVQYKIGSLCMDMIDYELKRYETMQNDLENRRNPSANGRPKSDSERARDQSKSADFLDTLMNEEKPRDMEPPRRKGRIPELKQRPKSGNWGSHSATRSSSLLRSHTMNNSYHEQLCLMDRSMSREQSPSMSLSSPNEDVLKKNKDEYERMNKQLRVFAKKQEQLLRVSFYLLLNVAENVRVEEKMRKKNIVKMLIKTLERKNVDLLTLVVTFLKKLSIVRDNKNEMYDLNIVEKLPRLLLSSDAELIQITLSLIFNLSFDGPLRAQMIQTGMLPKLVTFLSDTNHHEIVIKILYHMSLDDKVKSMFTYTECVPLVIDMLILNLNQKADLNLIALCVNLALNKKNAEIMIDNNRLHTLMGRAFKYQDSLLMKLLRNISQHENLRIKFVDFVGDLAEVLTVCDDQRFVIECLGILGNLSVPDLDYSAILNNFNLIPWLMNVLTPGKYTDDIILDAVVFLGTISCDESCAMILCKAEVILALIELLKAKQEDDEMVLQIVFVFQQILRNESTRSYMIKETESPAYLIDLMHDKNADIRKVCDYCLDIIAAVDADWATRIKLEKFRNHNTQWLNMIEASQQDLDDSMFFSQVDDDDSDIPRYLVSEYLGQYYQQNHYQKSDDGSTRNGSSYSRQDMNISGDLDDLDDLSNVGGKTRNGGIANGKTARTSGGDARDLELLVDQEYDLIL